MPDASEIDYEIRALPGAEQAAAGTPQFAIHVRREGVVGHVIAWTVTGTEARYIVSALRREDRRRRSLVPELGRLLAAEAAAGAARPESGRDG